MLLLRKRAGKHAIVFSFLCFLSNCQWLFNLRYQWKNCLSLRL